MDAHRLAEERSLALHRVVADRLATDSSILERARARVDRLAGEGVYHPSYTEAWRALLEAPIDLLCAALVERSERMCALRQCTPFTFVVEPRLRARLWKETKAAMALQEGEAARDPSAA